MKYLAYMGGGATFYLADSRTGEGVSVEVNNKEEAAKKIEDMLLHNEAYWALSDDPEAEGEMIVEEDNAEAAE